MVLLTLLTRNLNPNLKIIKEYFLSFDLTTRPNAPHPNVYAYNSDVFVLILLNLNLNLLFNPFTAEVAIMRLLGSAPKSHLT
jgi:hypothetical protein